MTDHEGYTITWHSSLFLIGKKQRLQYPFHKSKSDKVLEREVYINVLVRNNPHEIIQFF